MPATARSKHRRSHVRSRRRSAPLHAPAEPVEPCHQRLLQRRWDRLDATMFTPLQQEPGHFLNKQRYAAGSSVTPSIPPSAARVARRVRRPYAELDDGRVGPVKSYRDESAYPKAGETPAAQSTITAKAPARRVRRCRAKGRAWSDRPNAIFERQQRRMSTRASHHPGW